MELIVKYFLKLTKLIEHRRGIATSFLHLCLPTLVVSLMWFPQSMPINVECAANQ